MRKGEDGNGLRANQNTAIGSSHAKRVLGIECIMAEFIVCICPIACLCKGMNSFSNSILMLNRRIQKPPTFRKTFRWGSKPYDF